MLSFLHNGENSAKVIPTKFAYWILDMYTCNDLHEDNMTTYSMWVSLIANWVLNFGILEVQHCGASLSKQPIVLVYVMAHKPAGFMTGSCKSGQLLYKASHPYHELNLWSIVCEWPLHKVASVTMHMYVVVNREVCLWWSILEIAHIIIHKLPCVFQLELSLLWVSFIPMLPSGCT